MRQRWKIREVRDRGRVVQQYDISVRLPDGARCRERRVVPEFDDEGRRIATKAAREQWVIDRFAFLRSTGRRTPSKSRHDSKRSP